MAVWYGAGTQIGGALGFNLSAPDSGSVVGVEYFYTPSFV